MVPAAIIVIAVLVVLIGWNISLKIENTMLKAKQEKSATSEGKPK
jgi:hypothetical protein